jgi:hypothetical protein
VHNGKKKGRSYQEPRPSARATEHVDSTALLGYVYRNYWPVGTIAGLSSRAGVWHASPGPLLLPSERRGWRVRAVGGSPLPRRDPFTSSIEPPECRRFAMGRRT